MKNNKGRWLFYIGLLFLIIGSVALICTIIFEFIGNKNLLTISGIVVAVSGPIAIILLIIKFIFYGGAESPQLYESQTFKYNKKEVPVTDVKEVKKSQDEIMYDKYVELYNQKIISKEDLEKKRIELLGK